MKIVVIGGRGRVGSRIVTRLTREGHDVVAASRRSGVDIVTGEGLADALRGASVVVDASDSPSFDDSAVMEFFTASTSTLLAHEAAAGVRHHVGVSVAGTERLLQGGYFRAKYAQEKLIEASTIPYSIVRTTQFFEFLDGIADAATQGNVVRVPPALLQPMAADDVAGAIAKMAAGAPVNGRVEFGGPEPFYVEALLERILGARNDPRRVIADEHALYFGAQLNERSLLAADDAELGETRFDDWLDRTARSRPDPDPPSGLDTGTRAALDEHQFRISDVPPGSVLLLGDVAVFSVEGGFCATQARCPHRQGPLSEGTVDGSTVTCPLHGARFNVWTGAVLGGPASVPLKTYAVTVEGGIGCVEVPLAQAVQGAGTMLTETARSTPLTSAATASLMFPTLTGRQIERIAAHGVVRPISRGDVLIESGQTDVPFFVVKAGEIEIVRPSSLGDLVIAFHRPGQFTGEVSMLLGRPAMMRVRASESGEVVQLTRDQMHALIQTDSEMSDVLMKALLSRRLELVAQGIGDALLIGSARSAATLRVRAFLTRNGHPFKYLDLDRDADVRDLLVRFHVDPADIPVLICRGEGVLRNPSNQTIADHLGFNARIDQMHLRDVVIVGAGPAGLAAAVYAASDGLDALVIEANSPGGQAGASSRIENYLGFPTGISGQELAGRAYAQAQKFGATVMIAKGAAQLVANPNQHGVRLGDGATVPARAVIIASGARYRKPALPNLAQYEGAGVYYSATFMEEAQLGDDEEVIVVGGGNSAGQAAVFLARTGRRVHVLVRSHSLSASMSRYLVRRIEESAAIQVRTETEIVGLEGCGHLERVLWRDGAGVVAVRDVRHVFLMTGAEASTGWLDGCVALDEKGFVKTGPDLTSEDLAAAQWPLERPPYLLETSRPGVFAVGDVRSGNIKRVASAVGEGSIAIAFVHRVLAE